VLEGPVADLALAMDEHGTARGTTDFALVATGLTAVAQGQIRQGVVKFATGVTNGVSS
jgi:hypothetical protein